MESKYHKNVRFVLNSRLWSNVILEIEYYNMFNVPALYASLITIFGMAVVINLPIDFILSKAVVNR